MLCNDLKGFDGGGGREAQQGGDVCVPIADLCFCKQKPTQHCKAIILQFKKKMLKKRTAQ